MRTPGEINWALFSHNSKSRKSVTFAPRPSAHGLHMIAMPSGGYSAARERRSVAFSADACSTPMNKQNSCPSDTSFLDRPLRSTITTTSRCSNGPNARLCGSLLKQSGAFLRGWQARYFEVADGKLRWWTSLEEKNKGKCPQNELRLKGAKVHQTSATQFTLHVPSSEKKGKVYVLDVPAETSDPHTWVKALEQEAILARGRRPSLPAC